MTALSRCDVEYIINELVRSLIWVLIACREVVVADDLLSSVDRPQEHCVVELQVLHAFRVVADLLEVHPPVGSHLRAVGFIVDVQLAQLAVHARMQTVEDLVERSLFQAQVFTWEADRRRKLWRIDHRLSSFTLEAVFLVDKSPNVLPLIAGIGFHILLQVDVRTASLFLELLDSPVPARWGIFEDIFAVILPFVGYAH